MGIWDEWKQAAGRFRARNDGGPDREDVKALSDQFRITLRASVERMRGRCGGDATFELVAGLIDDEASWSWNRAYEVEQLLVQLYDSETLETELACRIREAGSVLRPQAALWYQQQLPRQKTDERRRALLGRLINDLQWRYTVNEARRGYTKEITKRTGQIFVGVVGLFLLLSLVVSIGTKDIEPGDWKLLFLVASAGAWGAVFSMLTGLRTRLDDSSFDDLKLSRSIWMLVARVLIGLGAALVLLFFFVGGMLEGSIFPDMSPEKSSDAAGTLKYVLQGKDVALLIVWSFLSGFSERMVPNLLSKTEGHANGDAGPGSGARSAAPEALQAQVDDSEDEDDSEAEREHGADGSAGGAGAARA